MSGKKDINQVAFAVVQQATGAAPKPRPLTAKQLAGKKGGEIGGKRRMELMTDEERRRLAMMGVAARTKPPGAKPGGSKSKKA